MTINRFYPKSFALISLVFVVVAAGMSHYIYRLFLSNENASGSIARAGSAPFATPARRSSPNTAHANADFWIERARSLSSAGKFDAAGQAFEQAVRLKGELPAQIYADYAGVLTLEQSGRMVSPKAEQLVEKALDQDPTNKKALFLAGSAAMQARSYDKAVEHWQKLLTQIPAESSEHRLLSDAITKARNQSGATDAPRSAVPLGDTVEDLTAKANSHPNDAKQWAELGKALMDRGEYTGSSDAYKKAAELTKMRSPQILADYAASLAMRENQNVLGEPGRILRKALALDPANKKALFLAGMEATQRKDYKDAISLWTSLLAKLRPESAQYEQVDRRIAQARQMLAEQKASIP